MFNMIGEIKWMLVPVLAILCGIYLNYPLPQLSDRLKAWKEKDSSYFTIHNKRIFYKDYRSSNRPKSKGNLLLLHGFPTSSFDWLKIWQPLEETYERIIAPDFLGFGFSDKPLAHNYTLMEQADIVVLLLKAIGVKQVHILSHDYGDSVLQELLARDKEKRLPFKILSACLTNGGMFVETNHPQPIQKLVASPVGKLLSGVISNRFLYGHSLSKIFGPSTQPSPEDLYDWWTLYSWNQGYKNGPYLLQYIQERAVNNQRWTQALQRTVVPVHIIYGPSDPVNPPYFIDYLKKTVPKASLTVLRDSIGHYVQWEDSDSVKESYLSFLNTVSN